MIFILHLVITVYHTDWFVDVNHPGINPSWSWCVILLIHWWILLANILLRIFASMFIRGISLILFFVASLSGFGIWVMLIMYHVFGRVPPLLFFGRIWEDLVLILFWMFGRIHQWSHSVLDFCLLGVLFSFNSLEEGTKFKGSSLVLWGMRERRSVETWRCRHVYCNNQRERFSFPNWSETRKWPFTVHLYCLFFFCGRKITIGRFICSWAALGLFWQSPTV